MTHKVSQLLTNPLYSIYFDQLIDACFSSNNNTHWRLLLIENSLYISELARLSVAIPSEFYNLHPYIHGDATTDYNFEVANFQTYSIRASNTSINQTLRNITVNLNYQDTSVGRKDFAEYSESFNSVDTILIALKTDHANNHNNYNYQNNKTNIVTNVSNSRLSVNILSNITEIDGNYPLNNNISIIFQRNIINHEYKYNLSTYKCVWLQTNYTEKQVWSSDGCTTGTIDSTPTNSHTTSTSIGVECNCNHLTTFAILQLLDTSEYGNEDSIETDDDDDDDNDMLNAFPNNYIYFAIVMTLIIGFAIIALFVAHLFYKLMKNGIKLCNCKKDKNYETAFGALFFTLIEAITQINSCLMFYIFIAWIDFSSDNFADSNTITDYFREFVTISVLLPLLISFYIFSHTIYGMAIVAQSLSNRFSRKRKQLQNIIIFCNIMTTLTFVFIMIALAFDLNQKLSLLVNLLLIFELIYIGFMLVPICFVCYYSFKSMKVIHNSILTLKSIKSVSSTTNTNTHEDASTTITTIAKRKATLTANSLSKSNVNSNNSSNLENNDSNTKGQELAMRRILFACVSTSSFILIQIGFTVYFAIFPNNFQLHYQLIDIFCNLLFLIQIIYLYQHYIKAKIKHTILDKQREEQEKLERLQELEKQRRLHEEKLELQQQYTNSTCNTNSNSNHDDDHVRTVELKNDLKSNSLTQTRSITPYNAHGHGITAIAIGLEARVRIAGIDNNNNTNNIIDENINEDVDKIVIVNDYNNYGNDCDSNYNSNNDTPRQIQPLGLQLQQHFSDTITSTQTNTHTHTHANINGNSNSNGNPMAYNVYHHEVFWSNNK